MIVYPRPNQQPYACPETVAPRDCVYLVAANCVDAASAAGPEPQVAVGFVDYKVTPTLAMLVYGDELPRFVGLTPGATYYLSLTPGEITTVAPTEPGQIVQRVGWARDPETLVVDLDRDFEIL